MKQMKVLSVLGLALALGLTACGGGGKKGTSTKHTHTWGDYTVVKAATCTEDGSEERVCSGCGEKQTKTIKAAHQWGEYVEVTAATCSAEGKEQRECSVCHEKQDRAIEKLPHTFAKDADGNDVVVWTTEPGCEVAGVGAKECTVCHESVEVNQEALGHTYAKVVDAEGNPTSEDVVVWSKEATCTEAGVGEKECTRCHQKATVNQEALGHDIHLRADTTEPAPGKAAVRIYECSRCDVTYFGFKATEVSPDAGRLVFEPAEPAEGEEQGARFWGRPIGNAMELGEDGSASGSDAEKIFDETVQGDLFEYVFDLTAPQVAELGDTCLLYCDAKPANYLNGQDFWACDPTAEEWTPGYYIEGEHKGEPIADYRYILYVDDQPVQFDSTMTAPVARSHPSQNIPRGEYVMPYKFHLHTGTNKISLRMAGGYRSLFYNFTFRPLVEQGGQGGEGGETETWVEDTTMAAPETGAALVKRYTKGEDVKYEIDVKTANMTVESDGDWKTKPETGAFKLNNGKTATFNFALPKAFSGKMYQSCYMDSYNSNKTKKMFYQTNNHCNIEVKVNGNAIDFSKYADTTFQEVFGDETNGSNSVTKEVELGDVVLESGNVITYKRVETLNMLVEKFVFIGKDHDHAYTAGDKAADSALRPVTCTCGASGYELQAADLTEGQKAPVASDKNTRLGKNIFDDVWNITGIRAGKYALYLNAQNSSGNDNAYWNAATAIANGDRASNNGSTAEQQADYRYKVKIDNGEYTPIANDTERYSDFGMSSAAAAWTNKPVAVLTIAEGAASLTISNMNNGYSIWIYAARLLPVA